MKVHQPVEELSLPSELICTPIELAKVFTYCATGNLCALKSLLDL